MFYSQKILKTSLLPRFSLQNRIIENEEKNRKFLEDACAKLSVRRIGSELVTGEIRARGSSKGEDAFKRYLNTAIEFGLIVENGGRLYNTKKGEVLSGLSEKSVNPFTLSLAQKYWFFKVILEKDYDYTRTALICSIEQKPHEEQEFFRMLKELWEHKLTIGTFRSPEKYDELKKAISTKWKAQKRYYLENIKAPRLEWFLDLTAIDFWNLKQNRVTVHDSLRPLLDSDEKNFSSLFVSHMKPLLRSSVVYWNDLLRKEKDEWLQKFLLQCFNLFTISEALPKISVNQVMEYSLSILAQSGIVCNDDEFESELERFVKARVDKYRYVKTISEADRGYVSKL